VRLIALIALLLAAGSAALAQLTPAQKLEDFSQLVALFDKRYAPYDWKKQAVHYDLLDVQPWLDRVAQTQTDLDYYQVSVDYVSALQDGNSMYIVPSNFRARLGFIVQPVAGHLVIVTLDRRLLPAAVYPFDLGDELMSLDGQTAAQLIDTYAKVAPAGTARARQAIAAQFITDRQQAILPHAADVGDRATAVIRRATGATETYSVPWTKTGAPVAVGPVPDPTTRAVPAPADEPPAPPSGQYQPLYVLPDGFVQRLGRSTADGFFSGTFPAGGRTLGYLRIGRFSQNTGSELTQLDAEIAYMRQNTDGLVVDAWGASGSSQCYTEELAARFFGQPFKTVSYQVRATQDWISTFESRLNLLVLSNAPAEMQDQARAFLDIVRSAYQENRGLAGPVPLCSSSFTHAPASDRNGVTAYTKPLVVLINELTSGPAEFFAATLQDAGRGILLGTPTAGVGSISSAYLAGSYAEGTAVVSTAMALRAAAIKTEEFGETNVIENVGVRPDVTVDIFTVENLATRGGPYVAAFTKALLDAIAAAQ
jgi:hypothetical protein